MTRMAKLGVRFPFMVAPMVGISHVGFRELIRSYLPEDLDCLCFTEMLSTRRLPAESLRLSNELRCAPGERFYVPQLLGNEESFIAKSVAKLMPLKPWGFDINMGCPVRHTLRHNWGVRLMGDEDYAASVVAMTKRHSPVPVSVKMRGGLDTEDGAFLDRFTGKLEDAGADWLTIHPRPKSQKHKGKANWQLALAVAKARGIPVVVNGDIQTAEDAMHMVFDLGIDGAMVGRAATARPWVLGQVARRLGLPGVPVDVPDTLEEEGKAYLLAVVRYCSILDRYFDDEQYKIERIRFFVATGSKWFHFGHSFWKACLKLRSSAEVAEYAASHAQTHHFPMTRRIEHF